MATQVEMAARVVQLAAQEGMEGKRETVAAVVVMKGTALRVAKEERAVQELMVAKASVVALVVLVVLLAEALATEVELEALAAVVMVQPAGNHV